MDRLRNAPPAVGFGLTVAVAALVQLAVTGEYLFHGGLFTDDWPWASTEHFAGGQALLTDLTNANHDRPIGNLYLTLTTVIAGADPELHALWGFLTHLACVVAVYFCARALGMALPSAAALGLLVSVSPFSDSIWLWYAASHSSIAIALGAVGVILAVRGLRSTPAWPWHLGAAAAFAASVLTYQVIVFTVVLMLALYWPRATNRRTALLLWAKDLAAVALGAFGPTLLYGGRGDISSEIVASVDGALDHAEQIADQGFALLGQAILPFGDPNAEVVVFAAICVIVAGSAIAGWGAPEAAARIRRSLAAILLGAGIVVTGYMIYVPGVTEFYQPLIGGQGNRVNALTGVGYCLIVVALATLLARILATWRRWPQAATLPFALALVALVAIGYVIVVQDDIDDWKAAAQSQEEQLAALEGLGRPPLGTANYVYGGVGETANGVFAFRVNWDLNNAVRLLWDTYDLRTYPIFEGTEIFCGGDGLFPDGRENTMGYEQGAPYPDAFFTDLRTGERVRIEDREACLRHSRRFEPGPVGG